MKHYLGVDIGTYETKGVIVNGAGEVVASAVRGHQMLVPQPGWAEHDAELDWWGDFVFVTRKMLGESGVAPSSIACIATSAIGPCMLPVDSDGNPLMKAVLYGVDTRATREIVDLTAQIGDGIILETCGNALTPQSVGPKILWLKRNRPEVFARTHKFLNSTSFLIHRLTGNYVTDHYSACGLTPFYMADRLCWSDELAPGIVGMDKMPNLMWTTDIAGHVTSDASEATGLKAGTPVMAGTIDAAAEAISVGVTKTGDMMLMYGSTIFIIQITNERVRDSRLWYGPWLFPGQHAAMAGHPTSGTLTHWMRRVMASNLAPDAAIEVLNAEALASPAGARGLVVLPYFSGTLTPLHDPGAKGLIFGLDLTHTRGDLFRAALEGIAQATRHIFETYSDAGIAPEAIHAVGGGTKSKVWSQATSDICGVTQIVRQKTLGASYGDAFLAALAVGDVRHQDIDSWNPVAFGVKPDLMRQGLYDRQHMIFRELYTATRGLLS
jgi:xylulokinase